VFWPAQQLFQVGVQLGGQGVMDDGHNVLDRFKGRVWRRLRQIAAIDRMSPMSAAY
jgi:hypothetical protein